MSLDTSHAGDVPTNEPDTGRTPPGDLLVIGLMLAAAFVVILNETIMANALRPLMLDLGVDERTGQWLSTAFMLTMAVVIPLTGWVIQRFSTRTVFITAMTLFTTGTVIALVAPNFPVLLAGRIVQASGTAVMMPLLMTTILNLVPMQRRGAMMGNITIVMSLAPALGPTASGLILQGFGTWRAIFGVMVPIALTMLILGILKLVNVGESGGGTFDAVSIPLAVLGFGGIVYTLSQIGESSGGGVPIWVSAAIGVVGVALFMGRQLQLQRRTGAPLLDLRTFRHRRFGLGLAVMVIAFAGLMGTAILLPLYLQGVLGLVPLQAGLVVLPGGIVMGLSGPIVGRIFDRFGPRVLALPGTLLLAASLFAFSRAGESTPVWMIVAAHIALMVGLSMLFTPMFTTALNDLPPHLYPHGSAWLGSLQQVAGAAGTALLVTVSATVAVATAGATGDPAAAGPQAAGFETAMSVGAVIALLAVPLVLALGRGKPTEPVAAASGPVGDGVPAAEAPPAH
ncbi:MDR family MFS transporter [Naumannella huperziae]